MTRSIAVEDVPGLLKPGTTMYVPGLSGESLPLYAALKQSPQCAAGVRFTGVHFPGINRSDYLGLHPQARQRAYFMQPNLRPGLADGRAELLPLDYPGIYRDFARRDDIDIMVAQVTPPDADGVCSFGPSMDFIPAVWPRARLKIAHVNPRFPRTRGSFSVKLADFDLAYEADAEILPFASPAADDSIRRLAANVASLVRDGDTVQFGIGKIQSGILEALSGLRRLRVFSGMVSPPLLPLIDGGAIQGAGAVQAGVALGDAAFYERMAKDPSFHFMPVSESHDLRRVASIPNFCAINSAVEVDLFGQVNSDRVGGKLVAGVGGFPPYAIGARLSPGGRSVVALPAATDDGKVSRIAVTLDKNSLTSLGKHDADYVVTEHGVASLGGLSIHARAQALIAVAAPQFREALAQEWSGIVKRL
ncbi:MAG: acetyl-CoA hydrolase [Nevskia sp.]|nr:acetyl-CoA hydrolase [Nevskia sp.]